MSDRLQFQESELYDVFYEGHRRRVRFSVWHLLDQVLEPLDLTSLSPEVVLYDDPEDASARVVASLSVSTDTNPDSDGNAVTNICEGAVTVTGGALGDAYAKLQIDISGAKEIVGKPWEITIFDGGPTS